MATVHSPRRTSARARGRVRRRRLIAVAVIALAVAIYAIAHGSSALHAPRARSVAPPPPGREFAYEPGRERAFVARAIAGEAHALFSESPGGALATAARVARLRPLIDAASRGTGIDPDLLEGLVFVESAGRPDAVAGGDPSGAAGLTQILPATAVTMLGLHVDVAASRRLTAAIQRDRGNGAPAAAVARLQARRARADQRFDPRRALAATVRYLQTAEGRFGLQDLAFVSYHMGIGNLAGVLTAYDGGPAVPYAQLYFDSAPDRHPAAFRQLSGFADQSALYYWRVLGAAALMRLYRTDRPALTRVAGLQVASDSSALVLHPPDRTPTFGDPSALSDAYADGRLLPLPANAAQLGLAYSATIGQDASHLHAPAGLYRGLRPAALAVLLEIAARVRSLAHGEAPLIVSGAVADRRYQQRAGVQDPPQAGGWSFRLARRYVGNAQRGALQALLDRLQALNLIAWSAYPGEIEVTVSADAPRVLAHGA